MRRLVRSRVCACRGADEYGDDQDSHVRLSQGAVRRAPYRYQALGGASVQYIRLPPEDSVAKCPHLGKILDAAAVVFAWPSDT